ncbi:hypothetical protein [Saccharophagus degradans]|uniref:Uncharacterized protein n=1 Tax=Saccharophagus degradans TaxID=86304 RepID=A0AAW7X0V3_9GAMM|nr:hypothetical protein [Saccharophagus degradans]MDO6421139.1 hypothetical protein [Saccharophagus degradans]MDO6605950.1 hypothetical protein [Saccharophagus degradans]
MFELVVLVQASEKRYAQELVDCFVEARRPDFEEELSAELAWIFPIVEVIPNAEKIELLEDGTTALIYWQTDMFDIEALAKGISENQFRCLAYFYRYYEDVGTEDDPMPNGIAKVATDGTFKNAALCSSDQIYFTSEIIALLKDEVGLIS